MLNPLAQALLGFDEDPEGARVVVDSSSLELLAGATIDFEDDKMKSAFVVAANPQSSASCGCGTSFQVEI